MLSSLEFGLDFGDDGVGGEPYIAFCENTDAARLTADHWQPSLGEASDPP